VAESEKERTDRQLIELLNELRVALPGALRLPAAAVSVVVLLAVVVVTWYLLPLERGRDPRIRSEE
jgi:hypothetical protein